VDELEEGLQAGSIATRRKSGTSTAIPALTKRKAERRSSMTAAANAAYRKIVGERSTAGCTHTANTSSITRAQIVFRSQRGMAAFSPLGRIRVKV
jgi:hypothetical protein